MTITNLNLHGLQQNYDRTTCCKKKVSFGMLQATVPKGKQMVFDNLTKTDEFRNIAKVESTNYEHSDSYVYFINGETIPIENKVVAPALEKIGCTVKPVREDRNNLDDAIEILKNEEK